MISCFLSWDTCMNVYVASPGVCCWCDGAKLKATCGRLHGASVPQNCREVWERDMFSYATRNTNHLLVLTLLFLASNFRHTNAGKPSDIITILNLSVFS